MAWVANRPEQRFSIAVDRFLSRALIDPKYITAAHDADGGGRTDLQRARDRNRGVKGGALDWDVAQPGLHRKLELKRGKNDLSDKQRETVRILTECRMPPVVAWTLREVYDGLLSQGFSFHPNVVTLLQHYEAQLSAWDREAELIKTGAVVKKRAAPRKAAPRYQWKQKVGGLI